LTDVHVLYAHLTLAKRQVFNIFAKISIASGKLSDEGESIFADLDVFRGANLPCVIER
jgi:hypothetical protein